MAIYRTLEIDLSNLGRIEKLTQRKRPGFNTTGVNGGGIVGEFHVYVGYHYAQFGLQGAEGYKVFYKAGEVTPEAYVFKFIEPGLLNVFQVGNNSHRISIGSAEFICLKVDIEFIEIGHTVQTDVPVEVGILACFNNYFTAREVFNGAFYFTG